MPRTKKAKKQTEPLTGEALLDKVKELENSSKEEKARKCGYITVTSAGKSRVNIMKFQNALLDAMGMDLEGSSSGNNRSGRSASYRIRVHSNGTLLIGSAYTAQMGLEPGDEFEIQLGRKHIKLVQVLNEETTEVDEEEA